MIRLESYEKPSHWLSKEVDRLQDCFIMFLVFLSPQLCREWEIIKSHIKVAQFIISIKFVSLVWQISWILQGFWRYVIKQNIAIINKIYNTESADMYNSIDNYTKYMFEDFIAIYPGGVLILCYLHIPICSGGVVLFALHDLERNLIWMPRLVSFFSLYKINVEDIFFRRREGAWIKCC